MMRNAMDQVWMNSVIPTFKLFTIQRKSGDMCTLADLKNIDAQDFKILLDNISVGANFS